MRSQTLLEVLASGVANKPILWDIIAKLGLYALLDALAACHGINGHRNEACGWAESGANNVECQKCKNKISESDHRDALHIVLQLAQMPPLKVLEQGNLRTLAELLLCSSRHRRAPWSNVERLLDEWKRMIKAEYGRQINEEDVERLDAGNGTMQERPDIVAMPAMSSQFDDAPSTPIHHGDEVLIVHGTFSGGRPVDEDALLERIGPGRRCNGRWDGAGAAADRLGRFTVPNVNTWTDGGPEKPTGPSPIQGTAYTPRGSQCRSPSKDDHQQATPGGQVYDRDSGRSNGAEGGYGAAIARLVLHEKDYSHNHRGPLP